MGMSVRSYGVLLERSSKCPPRYPALNLQLRRRLLALCVGATLALGAGAISAQPRLETAVFSGGCFWTMEHGLEAIPGVVRAVSGYAGGNVAHPTYEQVNTETTGHLESVQVTYDPAKITYAQLVDRYWRADRPYR